MAVAVAVVTAASVATVSRLDTLKCRATPARGERWPLGWCTIAYARHVLSSRHAPDSAGRREAKRVGFRTRSVTGTNPCRVHRQSSDTNVDDKSDDERDSRMTGSFNASPERGASSF
jgi:hypothetical protein